MLLSQDPITAEKIADMTGLDLSSVMIILTKLEMDGMAREIWPQSFVRTPSFA